MPTRVPRTCACPRDACRQIKRVVSSARFIQLRGRVGQLSCCRTHPQTADLPILVVSNDNLHGAPFHLTPYGVNVVTLLLGIGSLALTLEFTVVLDGGRPHLL